MHLLYNYVLCYQFPAAYPSTDQSLMITGAFLTDPVIVAAINNVTALIRDKALLNIKPSNYSSTTPNSPMYNDDPVKTCYWPRNQCTRSTNPAIVPDITTCPGQNQWGITFDDGPSQTLVNGQSVNDSTALLAELNKRNIKATFFVVGARAIQFPQIIRAQYAAGHQIAMHTWSHKPLTSLTNEQIVAELKYNEAAIYSATKVIPRFVRAPYGDVDDRVRAIVQAMGYQLVFWSKDSTDSTQPDTSDASAVRVQQTISSWFVPQPGFISIQHDLWPFSTNLAIKGIAEFVSKGSPLSPMPIGTCLKQRFYSVDDNIAPNATLTTTLTNALPTNTISSTSYQTSTQAATPTNVPLLNSGTASAALIGSLMFLLL